MAGTVGLTATAVQRVGARRGTDLPAVTLAGAAKAALSTAQRPGLLEETARLLGDTLDRAARAESAREPSAATTTADRKGVFRHAEAPASVVAEGSTAAVVEDSTVVAVADAGNRWFVMFLVGV